MFNQNLIPPPNPQLNQLLQNLYAQAGTTADQKASIEKKFNKIDQAFQDKISNTITISEYLDQLWKQADLKEDDKEYAVKKLEVLQNKKKQQVKAGEQEICKTPANLDTLNAAFQTTPYEDFNYQAKLKHIKKSRKLDMESDLFAQHSKDLDILFALNRPSKAPAKVNNAGFLHYTGGLCDIEEDETNKKQKAEEFVKKIQEQKKAFAKKMKQIEESVENRELEELERLKRREQQDEEERMKEKKRKLEEHIKLLQARSEARIKESNKWESDYKVYLDKRPMFKEMEDKFKKGFVIPELEDRKKRLQEIRDFHKPIQKEELLQHEQKILKLVEERNQEKKEQLENKWNYQKPAFQSKYHMTVAEELSRNRKQKDDEYQELLKKKERISDLMQNVKERHMPKVDHQKELEMLGMIEKIKKKKDGRSLTAYDSEAADDHVDPKKLGVGYLKSVKEMVQKQLKENPRLTEKKVDEVAYATAPIKKHNYLADLRRENKLPTKGSQIDVIIKNKNLDYKDKKELLQSEVEKLEEKARRKEMVKKHKVKKGEEVYEDDEVDQIYISAIKAKLQMLGN